MLTICKSYLQSNNQELIYTNNNVNQDGQIYVNLGLIMKIFKFLRILIIIEAKPFICLTNLSQLSTGLQTQLLHASFS